MALPGIVPTDRIDCTLRNRPSTATIVVTKRTNVAHSGQFPFTMSANIPNNGTVTLRAVERPSPAGSLLRAMRPTP